MAGALLRRQRPTGALIVHRRFNCLGPFLGIQAVLEHLRRAEGAAIVNTCSTGAIRAFPNHAAYGSSKWALRGLTQAVAAELAPSIRVNAVFPGPVETPMLDSETEAWRSAKLAELPIGRFGTVDEVWPTAVLLASAEGSYYVGQTLGPNGGDVML